MTVLTHPIKVLLYFQEILSDKFTVWHETVIQLSCEIQWILFFCQDEECTGLKLVFIDGENWVKTHFCFFLLAEENNFKGNCVIIWNHFSTLMWYFTSQNVIHLFVDSVISSNSGISPIVLQEYIKSLLNDVIKFPFVFISES